MLSDNSSVKAVLLCVLGMFAFQAVFANEKDALIVPLDSPAALKTLEDRLPDMGWQVQRAPDGSLLLSAGSGLVESGTALTPRRDASEMKFFGREIGDLRRQLLTAGWGSVDTLDGDLILTPGVEATLKPIPAGKGSAIVEADHGGFDELRPVLASHGWRAERGENGDLLLYPKSTNSSFQDATPIQSSDPTAADIFLTSKSDPLFLGIQIENLRPLLINGGWGGVEHNGADLILRLAAQSSESSSGVSLAPKAVARRIRNPESIDSSYGYKAMKAVLTYHGWRVERGLNRSIVLYPSEVGTDPGNQDTAENTVESLFGMELQKLRRHLVSSGWRRVEQYNGDILIYTG